MHVSEQGKQQVQPREFWIAIGITVLALGGIGLYQMQTGHIPGIPRWFSAGLLLLLWTQFLFTALRYGRKARSPLRIMSLVGYTLFMGSDLVPNLGQGVEWAKNLGALMLIGFGAVEWIRFGDRMER